jgi:hypothetical protein
MDERAESWWTIEERPFRSDKPLVGPLIVWVRRMWNGVSTRWYVRPLIEQQNEVNRRLAEELAAARETIVALDREAADTRREFAQAIYGLRDELERLEERIAALEAQADGGEGV